MALWLKVLCMIYCKNIIVLTLLKGLPKLSIKILINRSPCWQTDQLCTYQKILHIFLFFLSIYFSISIMPQSSWELPWGKGDSHARKVYRLPCPNTHPWHVPYPSYFLGSYPQCAPSLSPFRLLAVFSLLCLLLPLFCILSVPTCLHVSSIHD